MTERDYDPNLQSSIRKRKKKSVPPKHDEGEGIRYEVKEVSVSSIVTAATTSGISKYLVEPPSAF